jgi:hypothetical protein
MQCSCDTTEIGHDFCRDSLQSFEDLLQSTLASGESRPKVSRGSQAMRECVFGLSETLGLVGLEDAVAVAVAVVA